MKHHTSSFFLLPSSLIKARSAFTLIELIVVVGIIGILAGVLMASFGSGTEAARAAKCLSNMRNLAQAAIAYAADNKYGVYPMAGSYAQIDCDATGLFYKERRGWISWLSKDDPYASRTSGKALARSFAKCDNVSPFCSDREDAEFALTNGVLWRYVNGNRSTYVCPLHQRLAVARGAGTPLFSYAMSAYFGYDSSNGSDGIGEMGVGMSAEGLKAERRLMFAELPFGLEATSDANNGLDGDAAYSSTANTLLDPILQYKATYSGLEYNKVWSGKAETLGFNHKSGKRYCAHVVFADGHTEKLIYPTGGGLSHEQLAALLCSAVDVGFNGSAYLMETDGDEE